MPRQGAIIAVLGLGIVGAGWLLGCKPQARDQPVNSGIKVSGPSPGKGQTAVGTSAEITGLRAELIDQETVVEGGRVSWSTRWRLCWTPVPGAVSYLVITATPEGKGPPREIAEPCYALTVANGMSTHPGDRPGRSPQLSLMQITLSVSVAARLGDGTTGPSSPDVPVGAEYP